MHHYVIDGYNLLFYLFGTQLNDFATQRLQLIETLNLKIEFLELDATIVFDSHYLPGEGSRSHFHHLEILYTPENIIADDYIIQKIKQSKIPSKEILVTNDKQLSSRARELTATTLSIDQFINWLNSRYRNKKHSKAKEKAGLLPTIKPEVKVHPKLLSLPPTVDPGPEPGSIDYYLAKFETSFKEKVKLEAEKPKKQVKKKNFLFDSEDTDIKSDKRTEFERWLEIFEKRSQQNDTF